MVPRSARDIRIALISGLGVYAVLMGGIAAWIMVTGDKAARDYALRAPSVTISLDKKADAVPQSWTEEAPKADAPSPVAETEPARQATAPDKTTQDATQQTAKETAQETAKDSVAMPAARPKWMKYARPFNAADTRPRIGVIVNDLGFVADTVAAARGLPPDVTLAFSSVAPDIDNMVIDARAAGHEILLTIPMEPENYPQNDPGPGALLTALSDADNITRLRRAMARADSYVAIMPAMGERFVVTENKLVPVLDVVKQEGLMIVDNTVNKNSLVAPLARLGKVPFARVDMVLDAGALRLPVSEYFAKLEELAKTRGQAVAMVLPYPVALDELKNWIAGLDKKGFVLAPVTALASEEIPVEAAEKPTDTGEEAPTAAAPAAAATPVATESLTSAPQTP